MRVIFFLILLYVPLSVQANLLHQAVRARDIVIVRDVLDRGGTNYVNAAVAGGVTALHLAVATDQPDIARLLLENGAEVNARTEQGVTPLHWAVSRDAQESISALLSAGAKVDAKALNAITPLHWAASRDAANAVQMLLDAGADPDARTDGGQTPLRFAMRRDANSDSAVILMRFTLTDVAAAPLENVPEADQPRSESVRHSESARVAPAETFDGETPAGRYGRYTLLVGDEIELQVFREADFSGIFRVEPGGVIRHGLFGAIEVAGLTVQQAEALITKVLNERYLVNPRVTLRVVSSQASEVLVMGEVRSPGSRPIPFEGSTTLLEIIAAAGGFTDLASVNRVQVIRQEDGRQRRIRVRASRIMSGAEPDFEILPNDVIMVPQTFF